MKKHYYKDEIKKLLIIYTVSFILASTIVMFLFISIYTNTVVRDNNRDANESIANQLTNEFNDYIDFINEAVENPIYTEYIQHQEDSSKIFEALYGFNNERKIKSIFYIVDVEGNTLVTNNYVEAPYSGVSIFLSGLFKQLKTDDEIVFMNNKVQIDISKRTIYSIGKVIKLNGDTVGYLVFDILEQDVNNVIHSAAVDIFVITDQYNNGILSTNSLILDEIGKLTITKKSDETIEFMDKEYYFQKGVLLDEYIYIYTFSELGLIYNLMIVSVLFMLVVMTIIIIIIIKAADYTAVKKTESINELIKSINNVKKGDLSAYVSMETGDEFEEIGAHFNKMLDEIDRHINVNLELNDRKRVAIIKQLEAQFNPHFIFNTLEILKYLIQIDQEKASELIVSFASLLRYSIDYEKKQIYLHEDLNYIKSYMHIQKLRYNKRLTYSLAFDDNLALCIVPKLIMQPIIENCIIHGYKSKETLCIEVAITSFEKSLVMEVKDDGDGIERAKLNEIEESLNSDVIESNSIGLSNVHRRLKLLYGEGYGLSIVSEEGKGTKVTITMPKEYAQ